MCSKLQFYIEPKCANSCKGLYGIALKYIQVIPPDEAVFTSEVQEKGVHGGMTDSWGHFYGVQYS